MGNAMGLFPSSSDLNTSALLINRYVDVTYTWPATSSTNGSTQGYCNPTLTANTTCDVTKVYAWAILSISAYTAKIVCTNSNLSSYFSNYTISVKMTINSVYQVQYDDTNTSTTRNFSIPATNPNEIYSTASAPLSDISMTCLVGSVGGRTSSGSTGVTRSISAGSFVLRLYYFSLT